jgi:hypothetical protein
MAVMASPDSSQSLMALLCVEVTITKGPYPGEGASDQKQSIFKGRLEAVERERAKEAEEEYLRNTGEHDRWLERKYEEDKPRRRLAKKLEFEEKLLHPEEIKNDEDTRFRREVDGQYEAERQRQETERKRKLRRSFSKKTETKMNASASPRRALEKALSKPDRHLVIVTPPDEVAAEPPQTQVVRQGPVVVGEERRRASRPGSCASNQWRVRFPGS